MPVKIEFETGNAAFADGGMDEVDLILRSIARQISVHRETGGRVLDANGNRIGSWSSTIDAEQEESGDE